MTKFIVIGGAGFIGSNLCRRLLSEGGRLVLVDNLSRRGASTNLDWLREHGDFEFIQADVRDADAMARLFDAHGDAAMTAHLAGQVAVTHSVADPREDFESNALGTFNVLEGIRRARSKTLLVYASTNKVYGNMQHLAIDELETRYAFRDLPHGIPETAPLDFHSPYGCSKGSADQYVRDYARIYGMKTVVLRQSCIYGPRQFGVEDQGWVAWFVIAAELGRPITVYGNGKQVRDLLYVDDLVEAYLAAARNPERVAGRVYNVGGGPQHTLSVWKEFGPLLERLVGRTLPVEQGPWRPGDQPVYVSDIRKIAQDLNWRPQTTVEQGLQNLHTWVQQNRTILTA